MPGFDVSSFLIETVAAITHKAGSIVVGLTLEPALVHAADRTAFWSRLGRDGEAAATAHPLDRLDVVKLGAAFESFEQLEITLFVHNLNFGDEFI